jgi:DNA topoisomerase III
VLNVCQALYETHKLTSYPRTDCAYLPESQHADAADVLAAIKHVNPELGGIVDSADPSIKSNTWDDSKITAHHGIIPTMHKGGKASLTDKERHIYELIVRAYLAQFYPLHEYMKTTVAAEVEGETFTASGKVVIRNGWRDAKTKPPARFTEGTLTRAMENIHKFVSDPEHKKMLREGDGIGTSATRASILSELKRREFLALKGKQIVSTALGRSVIPLCQDSCHPPANGIIGNQTGDGKSM